MVEFRLEKLPRPDGAPFKCTINIRNASWPYTERCSNKAAGLLTNEDFDKVQYKFSMGGRLVCEDHANLIEQYLKKLDPNG